jgi:hypothetical protein
MTGPVRRFDPAELSDDPAGLGEAELTAAAAMARDLEAIAERDTVPTGGFSDRVMEAIVSEPTPQPTRVFGLALRARRIGAAVAAVGDAWRVTFGSGRPLAVRGQALALVLVVAVGLIGLGGGAAVGAARLLTPDVAPTPSPMPSVAPSPPPSTAPSPSVEPSPSPTPTPDASPTDTGEPTETPEATATDDSGGNSGPGGGGDSGSDDSGSDDSSSGSHSGSESDHSGSDDSSSGSHSGSESDHSGSDDSQPDDSL